MNSFILTKAEAREIIEPYAQEIYFAVRNGFEDFNEMQSVKPVMENHSKATVLWDFIIQRAKSWALKYKDDVKIRKKRRMYLFIIKDKIAIKFKKFNSDLLSANIKTDQVNDFRNHLLKDGNLELFPMEIGWQVSEIFSLAQVDFISPKGDGILWRIEFREADKTYNELFRPEEEDIIQQVTLNIDTDNAKTAG